MQVGWTGYCLYGFMPYMKRYWHAIGALNRSWLGSVRPATRQDNRVGKTVPLQASKLQAVACPHMLHTRRQAKLDAMTAAAVCAQSYGPAALAPHLPALWAALRSELLPAAGASGPAPAPDEAQRLEDLARAAAECLTVRFALGRISACVAWLWPGRPSFEDKAEGWF